MEKPNYYAIIPADVRYDSELPPRAILLYAEITALSGARGYCWATNDYFAKLYDVHEKSISRLVSQLEKKGYIQTFQTRNEKGRTDRQIYLTPSNKNVTPPQKGYGGSNKNVTPPSNKNVTQNNTSINIKNDIYKGDVQFAEYVYLKQSQYDKLVNDFGKEKIQIYIDRLDEWNTNNPKKHKVDHFKTIKNWLTKDNVQPFPKEKPYTPYSIGDDED